MCVYMYIMCEYLRVCVSWLCSDLSERPANVLVEGISIRDATTWSLAVANVTGVHESAISFVVTGARINYINRSVCAVLHVSVLRA